MSESSNVKDSQLRQAHFLLDGGLPPPERIVYQPRPDVWQQPSFFVSEEKHAGFMASLQRMINASHGIEVSVGRTYSALELGFPDGVIPYGEELFFRIKAPEAMARVKPDFEPKPGLPKKIKLKGPKPRTHKRPKVSGKLAALLKRPEQ